MKEFNINLKNKTILVTGSSGFIGSNLVLELLRTIEPIHIIGIDNMNDYYDVSIKEYRLNMIETEIKKHPKSSWSFIKDSIADKTCIEQIFIKYKPNIVINITAATDI